MRDSKRGRHEKVDCGHSTKTSTEIAGIERTVCATCGRVSFEFLYDVFAEEQAQLANVAE